MSKSAPLTPVAQRLIDELATAHLDVLAAVEATRVASDRRRSLAQAARAAGASWPQIATPLGMRAGGAHRVATGA